MKINIYSNYKIKFTNNFLMKNGTKHTCQFQRNKRGDEVLQILKENFNLYNLNEVSCDNNIINYSSFDPKTGDVNELIIEIINKK